MNLNSNMGQSQSGLTEDEFWTKYYATTQDYSVGPQTTWIKGNTRHKSDTKETLDYYRILGTNKYKYPTKKVTKMIRN